MVAAAGETMLSAGGVVSDPAGPCIVIVWETRLEPAVAVTVIARGALASGTPEIIQAEAVPCAIPETP